MKEFDISYDEVEQIANALRSKADKMQAILDDVTSKVNEVHNEAWHSSAAEIHLNEYNVLKSKYAAFYEKVKGCADFLDKAVKAGREIDAGIQNQAN
jgi:uncharacterized protein YukE